MPTSNTEIVVLTPRGGVYNHRYIIADGSKLDTAACLRIYLATKDVVGDRAPKCGPLNSDDRGYFAAACHEVAQQGSSGRRGREWLIVVDPRIERLDATAQALLLEHLKKRLDRLEADVLANICWEEQASTETVSDATLGKWRGDIEQHLRDEPIRGSGERYNGIGKPEKPDSSRYSGCDPRIAVAVIIAVAIAMWGGVQPSQKQTPQQESVLTKAASALGMPTSADESAVRAKVVDGLFLDATSVEGTKLDELLAKIRLATMGSKNGSGSILEDDDFWKALGDALPSQGEPSDPTAFLIDADKQLVVKGLSDPQQLRSLANIVVKIGQLDKDAATPDETTLAKVFKHLFESSKEMKGKLEPEEDHKLRVFTSNDVELAKLLVGAFKGFGDVIETHANPVKDRENLAGWVKAIGDPLCPGLFCPIDLKTDEVVATRNKSKPKEEFLKQLQQFCDTCRSLTIPHAPGGKGPLVP